MIRVSALYPNEVGGTFDHEYYETRHRELVQQRMGPMGLVRLEADRGVAGAGEAPAPYVAAGHLYFESLESFQAAFDAHGEEILGDIPNFTNIDPLLQVSEIAGGGG